MIDARNVYRKVTRKICDFSPEQQQNLLAVVRLYRGETARFLEIAFEHLWHAVEAGAGVSSGSATTAKAAGRLQEFVDAVAALRDELAPFLKTLPKTDPHAGELALLGREQERFARGVERFGASVDKAAGQWETAPATNAGLHELVDRFAPLADGGRDLADQAGQLCKRAAGLIETCERQRGARSSAAWNGRAVTRARRVADEARGEAVEQLRRVGYFWRQARWLTERFADGELRDVAGLVKLVDRAEMRPTTGA